MATPSHDNAGWEVGCKLQLVHHGNPLLGSVHEAVTPGREDKK